MHRSTYDDPDMPLSQLFREWSDFVPVFLKHGMLCPGCPIAPFHTITDVCQEYALDEDYFRAELSSAVYGKSK